MFKLALLNVLKLVKFPVIKLDSEDNQILVEYAVNEFFYSQSFNDYDDSIVKKSLSADIRYFLTYLCAELECYQYDNNTLVGEVCKELYRYLARKRQAAQIVNFDIGPIVVSSIDMVPCIKISIKPFGVNYELIFDIKIYIHNE